MLSISELGYFPSIYRHQKIEFLVTNHGRFVPYSSGDSFSEMEKGELKVLKPDVGWSLMFLNVGEKYDARFKWSQNPFT